MSLPGKLCIGILEEDNPQKSYFRFKPLLVAGENGFEPYAVENEFPENGCIRIVPDKNESSRFKARMRRIGRYCMVDLRDHPEENDKIRPNKNYRGDESEANANIIYSDVIREIPEGRLAEILPQEIPADAQRMVLKDQEVFSPRVCFAKATPAEALWKAVPADEAEERAFERTPDVPEEGSFQRFEIPGFREETLSFLIALPGKTLYTPEPASPAPTPAPAEARPMRERPAAPVRAEAAEAASAPAPTPAAAPVKPWLHRDESILPPPIDPRLNPREQAIAMQTGINPRRGRSLQEIVDDKWRHSRIDQLGHPVPGGVTAKPVTSPVDQALDAVKSAWNHVDARTTLVRAMAGVDGLTQAIAEADGQAAAEKHAALLKEYEDSREQLKNEIEAYRSEQERLSEELLARLRADNAAEIESHAKKIQALEEQEGALERKAEESRKIADSAEEAVAKLTDEKLTARLSEYAVNCRAANLLTRMSRGEAAPAKAAKPVTAVEQMCVGALSRRVVDYFRQNGCAITPDEAVNLLACFALGEVMIVTGPTGCGKTTQARLLTEALGLTAAGRVVDYVPAKPGENWKSPFPEEFSPYPAVLFADDVNAAPHRCERLLEDVLPLGAKVLSTAQDSLTGAPLNLRLLDRGFTVRLKAEPADSPWEVQTARPAPVESALTAEAIARLFAPDVRNIAPQVKTRLNALRTMLGRYGVLLSRRTLNGLWMYCAAVTPHLSVTPMEAFDLAFAQRALPSILASARVEALHALPQILSDMSRSLELLKQPLSIEI